MEVTELAKIAFLFPGQGSQSVGMGKDIHEAYPAVREIFDTAEAVSGLPIRSLCFDGPLEELTRTVNLQPAVTAVNLACLSVLREAGVTPDFAAGHSLGEYGALVAGGILTPADALRLVFQRGRLMHREAGKRAGAMAAIVGLSMAEVAALTAEARSAGEVSVANHNSETQIVITGEPEAVARASAMAAERKAKAIPLKVSGAWHSPLMKGAEADFTEDLGSVPFHDPRLPVIHNVTAETAGDGERIRTLMARQLCSPVRWHETMVRLLEAGVEVFAEVGPGKVLAGLARKALPKGYPGKVLALNDRKSLEGFVSELG